LRANHFAEARGKKKSRNSKPTEEWAIEIPCSWGGSLKEIALENRDSQYWGKKETKTDRGKERE